MEEKKEKKSHKKLWTVLFVLLNIAVIAYTAISEFGGESGQHIAPKMAEHAALYLLGAFGCLVIVLGAETAKYAYMMHVLGEKVSWRTAFETAALGKYYDSITPSGLGGQPFQIFWLRKHGLSDGAASAMPILGFITMQFGFIILAFIAFVTWRSVELEAIRVTAYVGLAVYSLIPGLLIVFSLKPKAVEKMVGGVLRFLAKLHIVKKPEESLGKVIGQLTEFHQCFLMVSGHKTCVLVLLILSTIFHAALFSMPYFVLKAFGGDEAYFHIFAAMAYVNSTASLSITPGNSGVAEGIFYIVFSSISTEGVFWPMLVWRLFCYYGFIAVGGIIFAYTGISARRKARKNQAFYGAD